MTISPEQIVKKMSGEGKKILDFFSELSDSLWNQKLYSDGAEWTVHEVLAHIVEAEDSLYRLFSNILRGGAGVPQDFDIDRYNASNVGKISGMTREDLLSLFQERRAQMVAFVGNLSSADLEKTGNHPYLGTSTLGDMLRVFLLHPNLHIRDIRRAFPERLK